MAGSITVAAVEPLAAAGKLSAYLLQLSPAFSLHEHQLEALAPLLKRLAPAETARDVRAMFKTTEDPDAPVAATRLRELLGTGARPVRAAPREQLEPG